MSSSVNVEGKGRIVLMPQVSSTSPSAAAATGAHDENISNAPVRTSKPIIDIMHRRGNISDDTFHRWCMDEAASKAASAGGDHHEQQQGSDSGGDCVPSHSLIEGDGAVDVNAHA